MTWMTMISRPKLTSSELNSTHAEALEGPLQSGPEDEHDRRGDHDGEQRIDARTRGQLVGQVGAEQDQPEVGQVDDPQHAPA